MSVKYSLRKLQAKAERHLDSRTCPHCLRDKGHLKGAGIDLITGSIGSTGEIYMYLEITGYCTGNDCTRTSVHVLHLEGEGAAQILRAAQAID